MYVTYEHPARPRLFIAFDRAGCIIKILLWTVVNAQKKLAKATAITAIYILYLFLSSIPWQIIQQIITFNTRIHLFRLKCPKWYPWILCSEHIFVVVSLTILGNNTKYFMFQPRIRSVIPKHLKWYPWMLCSKYIFCCCIFKILANNTKYCMFKPRIRSVRQNVLNDIHECYVPSVFFVGVFFKISRY